MVQLIVRGGSIIDGTGKPASKSDLVIDAGKVELVGDASEVQAVKTVDATGKINVRFKDDLVIALTMGFFWANEFYKGKTSISKKVVMQIP